MLFVLALWLPLGQEEFLIEHWMRVGTLCIPLVFGLMILLPRERMDFHRTGGAVLLITYLVHQFEEHWIDILGETYAFYSYVNTLVSNAFFLPESAGPVLTPISIYFINTSLVWLVGLLAIVCSPRLPFTAYAMAAIALVNGIVHIVAALVSFSYNPGLLSSVVLFLPVPLFFYTRVLRDHPEQLRWIALSILWAILAHAIMVGGLLAANVYTLFSEATYCLILIAWSMTPLAIGAWPARRSRSGTKEPGGSHGSTASTPPSDSV
ncbi:MAG: HXXEE domain-containing protein [Pseudomonadota bacterium]